MRPRLKKLIGMIVLIAGVTAYTLVVMVIGQARMAHAGTMEQLAFFGFFGLIWVVPAAFLIRWMERVEPRG